MKLVLIPILLSLCASIYALPTDVGSTTDIKRDANAEAESSAAANQCTLTKLKQILTDYTITEFEAARNANNGKGNPTCFIWKSDNCSKSPDRPAGFNFIPPCHRHDFGSRNYKKKNQWNPVSKLRTDTNFLKDMNKVCWDLKGWNKLKIPLCLATAQEYFKAVVLLNPPTDLKE
ncbi:hypothetical protein Q7P37_009150 [Cladosporium fusiforme]